MRCALCHLAYSSGHDIPLNIGREAGHCAGPSNNRFRGGAEGSSEWRRAAPVNPQVAELGSKVPTMASEQNEVETEDEKRRRRLAKRAAKEARRRDESLLAGYSNSANPWNDPHLDDQFVWNKKTHRIGAQDDRTSEGSGSHKKQRRQLADELLKVKEAREQREKEREDWEKERRELDRQREQMAYSVIEKLEDEFQLCQEQSRALKRVEEGRARPVDILAANLAALLPEGPPLEFSVPCEALVCTHSAPPRRLAYVNGDRERDMCSYCF